MPVSIVENQKVNVKDFVMPSVSERPSSELPEDIWRKIYRVIRSKAAGMLYYTEVVYMATALKGGLPFEVDWDDALKMLQVYRKDNFSLDFLELASNMAASGRKPELSVRDWDFMLDIFKNSNMSIERKINYAVYLLLLGSKVSISDQDFELAREGASEYRREKNWTRFLAVNSRLAFFGKKVEISDAEWADIQKEFNHLNNEKVEGNFSMALDILEFAGAIAILTADEIRIKPEGGIELVHGPKTPRIISDPLPERRAF